MKNTTLLRSQVTAVLALTLLLALFVPAVMAQSSGTSGLAEPSQIRPAPRFPT